MRGIRRRRHRSRSRARPGCVAVASLPATASAREVREVVATPAGRRPRPVQPGLGRQVRARERQARPGPHARHLRRLGRLHARRPLPRQEGPRPPGLGDRPPLPGARAARGLRAGAERPGVARSRCSTTTSAGSPTAAARPNHFQFLAGRRLPLRPPVGDGDRPERRPHRRAPGAGPRARAGARSSSAATPSARRSPPHTPRGTSTGPRATRTSRGWS